MSSTFSELATDLLLDHARQASSTEKYLIQEVLGTDPVELYAAMGMRATSDCEIKVGPDAGDVWRMRAVELPNGIRVIPYLVLDEGGADPDDPNRGNRGFNGKLRDWIGAGTDGEIRVLVTYDASPIETEKTAMDSAIAASVLNQAAFLGYLRARIADLAGPAVRPLLDDVVKFALALPSVTATDIDVLNRFARAASSLGDASEIGEHLVRLPWFLRDPAIEPATAKQRLRLAWKHRGRVDEWARSPEKDFREQVASAYKAEIADRLVASRKLGAVQWEQFTLSELEQGVKTESGGPEREKNGFNESLPASVPEAAASHWKLVGGEPAELGLVALVRDETAELRVSLKRALEERETLHVFTYSRADGGFARSVTKISRSEASESVISVEVPASPLQDGWAFAEVVLTDGSTFIKNFRGRLRVGLMQHDSINRVPYEGALRIEPTEQRFVVEDEPEVEARDANGDTLSCEFAADGAEGEGDGERETLTVELEATEVQLPVIYDIGDPAEPDEEAVYDSSAEHSFLRFAARRSEPLRDLPPASLSFSKGSARVSLAGSEIPLEALPALPAPRWTVEAEILRAPQWTAYRVGSDGSISADPRLEELVMEDLEPAWGRFLEARAALFSKLVEGHRTGSPASMLAADLAGMPECSAYTDAYAEALAAVPDGQNWRSEYERLLLVDSVSVAGQADHFVAPTSPLAVAAHSDLQRSIRDWQECSGVNLLAKDLDLVSPRYAVPMLKIGDHWCESRYAAYPWRRYARISQHAGGGAEPFVPGYIERRIEAFLDVHSLYKDRRRTLTLVFVNPGDGAHICQAVMRLMKRAGEKRLDQIPRFELRLYSAEEDEVGGMGAKLDEFMSSVRETGAPTWLENELMQRLTYTKGRVSDYLADAGAFAHIAFVENYFRPDRRQAYELHGNPATAYSSGMAFDLGRSAEVTANEVTFTNGVWADPQRASPVQSLACRSLEIAASAEGVPVTPGRARGLVTHVARRAIPQLYERSVWVVHIDRHIGLELFYPQAQGESTPFILDHTDQENVHESGFDGITATAMVDPYLALIERDFKPLVPEIDWSRAERLLRWLNLLSGRWALELLRQRGKALQERVGAVIAFRFLVLREGLFEQEEGFLSLVVSLDELLRVTPKEGLPLREGWAKAFELQGKASDDLLVLSFPLQEHLPVTVWARVIEVKYTETTPQTAGAWEQVQATHDLLSLMFGSQDRPGRLFRGRALARLIETYVARMTSYGLLGKEIQTGQGFRAAVNAIAAGDFEFEPGFWRGAERVIGDFFSVEPGNEQPVYVGAPYPDDPVDGRAMGRVRIGADLIRALVSDNRQEAEAGEYEAPSYVRAAGPPGGEDARSGAKSPPERRAADGQRPGEEPPLASAREEERPGDGERAREGDVTDGPERTEPPPADDSAAAGLGARFAVPMERLQSLADRLDQVFGVYDLPVQAFNPALAEAGPNVIRFKTRMLQSGRIATIESRARDIQRELGSSDPILIGQKPPHVVVDIPREERAIIRLGDVLPELRERRSQAGELPFVLGVNPAGQPVVKDLAQMPHLLVAGTTGSGKSVFLLTIAACLAQLPPSRVQLVSVDIKGLDLTALGDLPHASGEGWISDADEAVDRLQRLITEEVETRRALFRQVGARHVIEYYELADPEHWPKQIVVVIDEYAQLLSATGRGRGVLEALVQQYAQFARAFGIYLVLATQRPSTDVITGRIKANLPARSVFKLPSFNDSRTVIDVGGAEKLLGSGDMLFYEEGHIERCQAVLTEPADIRQIAGAAGGGE